MSSPKQIGTDGLENLKFLMDYTKFHIGLYTALFVGAITAIEKGIFPEGAKTAVRVAAFFLVLAGMAGGVIGSSIPNASSFAEFSTQPLGPHWLGDRGPTYPTWAMLEHMAFWAAILVVTACLVVARA